MSPRRTPPFWRDVRATAALEFAIVGPMLAVMLGGAADLGFGTVCRNRLAQAVGNGLQFAFRSGPTVSAAAVRAMVQASSGLAGVAASITGPALSCVSGSPAILIAASIGQTCPDGTAPGTYLSISAQYTYQPLMPLSQAFLTTSLQQSATVRLQ